MQNNSNVGNSFNIYYNIVSGDNMSLDMNSPKYKCPICGKVFYTYEEFEKHLREHYKPRVVGGVWRG